MELNLRNGMYVPKAPEIKDELAKVPTYCARYARMMSSKILIGKECDKGKLWTPKDGWNFRYFNRVVWSIEKGSLNYSSLKKGQIVGIRIPYSSYNERRDERKNLAKYSHLASVLGSFYDGEGIYPWIAHNIYGVSEPESLPKFLRRTGSVVMEVFSPRDESVLDDCV